MQTADKIPIAQGTEHSRPHAGHHSHTGNHVGRVSQLHSNLREWRTHWAHAKGDHIHGPTWGLEVRDIINLVQLWACTTLVHSSESYKG